MIKNPLTCPLIIFDLDGVLVDSKEAHEKALNLALQEISKEFTISQQEFEQLKGMNTKNILSILTQQKTLPKEKHLEIFHRKQELTKKIILEYQEDKEKQEMMKKLKTENHLLYCGSNTTFNTLKLILLKKGLIEYIDFFISCEDSKPKPNPDIYQYCISRSGYSPQQCLIVEDSEFGKQAAKGAGANLCEVKNSQETTYQRIQEELQKIAKNQN